MEIDGDEKATRKLVKRDMKFVNHRPFVNEVKFDNIPESILLEVLVRLPVKLLFSFKLVSTQWRSLISDPYFVRMYTSRASNLSHELQQPWTFTPCIMHADGSKTWDLSKYKLLVDIYSKDIRPASSLYVLRCPSAAEDAYRERYMILAVSNGLVLYGQCTKPLDRSNPIPNYNICNPITRKWIVLPPHARHPFRFASLGFVTRVQDGVLTSYRVVRLKMISWMTNVFHLEVFSSETGDWKDFDVYLDLEIEFARTGRPTCLNGILHWVTHKHGIIAYDPYHKPDSLRFIALPGDSHLGSSYTMLFSGGSICDAHQGRLKYFEMSDLSINPALFSGFRFWILNNYGTEEDWSLQHRISSLDILFDDISLGKGILPMLKPLYFHPFDSDIVFLGFESIIVSYNIKTRKLEACGVLFDVEDKSENTPHWWSIFLLVAPLWPIHIPLPPFGVTVLFNYHF